MFLIIVLSHFHFLMEEPRDSVVIIGSFSKHSTEIGKVARLMGAQGIDVLSPINAVGLNPDDPFVALATGDPPKSPHDLQFAVLMKILRTSLVYLVNPGGYVGLGAAGEVGYAALTDRPVLLHEPLTQFGDEVPQSLRGLFHGIPNAQQIHSATFQDQLALAKHHQWKLVEETRKAVRLSAKAWLDSLSKEIIKVKK